MNRRLITIAALTLAALALAACGGSSSGGDTTAATPATSDTAAAPADTAAVTGTLTGTVGPGFTITMDQTSVPAGKYTLTVDDQAAVHNFHLTGAGVDVTTSVPETGKKTFEITLTAGEYTFVCDPHSSQMKGTLTVT